VPTCLQHPYGYSRVWAQVGALPALQRPVVAAPGAGTGLPGPAWDPRPGRDRWDRLYAVVAATAGNKLK
jgi:hypothetical protein